MPLWFPPNAGVACIYPATIKLGAFPVLGQEMPERGMDNYLSQHRLVHAGGVDWLGATRVGISCCCAHQPRTGSQKRPVVWVRRLVLAAWQGWRCVAAGEGVRTAPHLG